MSKITTKDVALKAIELADANPEHVYQSPLTSEGNRGMCTYVHRDKDAAPTGYGCIFGQALMALGVDPDTIPESLHIGIAMKDLGVEATDQDLIDSMVVAQGEQDAGQTWERAVRHLRAEVAA